jgi:cysteinyl-tRNA synthetase
MLRFTNTLTGKKEPFTPLEKNKIKIYLCGPTVYGLTHIGNARPAVVFDVLMRFLEFRGFNIFFVRNYTDVDDKIINRAKEEKCSSIEISEKYTKAYDEDMASLGIRPPNVSPKVTTHIQEIISLIEKLIEKKAAYVAEDGEVFYSVKSFKEYGKLSGKKVDDLLVGVRIAADEKKRCLSTS